MKYFTPLFLLATAGLSLANNLPTIQPPTLPSSLPTADPIALIGELSPQCQAGLFSIIANPEFFECVPVGALLPLLTDPTLLPSVLKDPLANAAKLLPVVDAICAVPKCSDKSVNGALKTVSTECAADEGNPLIQIAEAVLTFYSPVRDVICFEDNKGESCLVESVTNILTLPPPPKDFHFLGGLVDKLLVAEPRPICTPCNKAILNTVVVFFTKHPEALQILEKAFNLGDEEFLIGKLFFFAKCGFEFLDGKIPDPSKIDPNKFTYQQADTSEKSLANQNDINLLMLGSFLASTLVLN